MKQYEIGARGFEVLHNSGGWRLAVHGYEEQTNGLSSLAQWGRHLDSEEAFVLLKGKAWLSERSEEGELRTEPLKPLKVYLVETGTRHAIVVAEDTQVLIAENRNMDNSVTEPISARELEQIRQACGK